MTFPLKPVADMTASPAAYELPSSTDELLWRVWLSTQWLPAVTAADELGIFDVLSSQPMTAEELAAGLDLNARGVRALLRTLGAIGFLATRLSRYVVTDASRLYLRRQSPHYSAAYLHLGRDARHLRLVAALRAGEIGTAGADGRPNAGSSGLPMADWARGSILPDRARLVARAMHAHSLAAAVRLAHNGWRGDVHRLLDVGGGSGCFSIALALRDLQLRCTIMELPQMCAIACEYVTAASVSDRVDLIAADMFRDEWPSEHDCVLFSNVLHDWNPDTATWLLRRAFEILPPGGRVFIHEMLLDDDDDGPLDAASFSLVMFVMSQGQQFTAKELASMLGSVGFDNPQVQPIGDHYSLVSARRP